MIIYQSLNISKYRCITLLDVILLTLVVGENRGEFPDEDKRNNKKALYPFYKFISPMRFQVIFYTISRCHPVAYKGKMAGKLPCGHRPRVRKWRTNGIKVLVESNDPHNISSNIFYVFCVTNLLGLLKIAFESSKTLKNVVLNEHRYGAQSRPHHPAFLSPSIDRRCGGR
jgi:hypothetical protein